MTEIIGPGDESWKEIRVIEPSSRRPAVVLHDSHAIALIKRTRMAYTYYLFPGGGVDEGESVENAAIREAKEELGLDVTLQELLAVVHFRDTEQYYFLGQIVNGEFGTGSGEELSSPEASEAGSYEPVWFPLTELKNVDVRPSSLVPLLLGDASPLAYPVEFVDE